MANNMRDIQNRMNTVKSTSQITNAMKLVSMSKYQQYVRKTGGFEAFMKEMKTIQSQSKDWDTLDTKNGLAICFSADLGLASLYQNTLYKELKSSGIENVLWIGKKMYDRIKKDPHFNMVNEKMMSSEDVDVEALFQQVLKWMKTYQIFVARPHLVSGESIEVEWKIADETLTDLSGTEFYPNYEEANARFVEMNMLLTLYDALYSSKTTEHMIRRLAMDTATDNAEGLHASLKLQYNRLRQEKITQEILELSSGMESR
ncbi:F0F1 ATP synthase subunit gamma [Allofustis seminis]|uniref:F0F1 ATP synthase subunit gamma n=1 Tax=Allofustis seminis TaxID=166939 RepID=UPI000361A89E|nr:F0F1 ATP synthase subunit gamma [Allofustis seminis]